MTIAIERAEKLAQHLNMNEKRAQELLSIPAEDACARINADGYDFITDELVAFADALERVSVIEQRELNEEDLDDIAGGLISGKGGCVIGIAIGRWFELEKNRWRRR